MKQTKTRKFGLFLIAISVSLVMVSGVNAWWDNDWENRVNITIDNSNNANTLTYFQYLLNITYDSDMKSDFSDFRFVASDDSTLLPYCIGADCDNWIENDGDVLNLTTVNSSFTDVIVKVDSITLSDNTTIFLYYNNPSASSLSHSESTWWINDEFNDASLNNTKWNTSLSYTSANGGYNFVESGGILNVSAWDDTDQYSGADILSNESFVPIDEPAIVWNKLKIYYTDYNYGSSQYFYYRDEIQSHSFYTIRQNGAILCQMYYRDDLAGVTSPTLSIIDPTTDYHIYSAFLKGDNYLFYQDGTLEHNATTNIPNDSDDYFSKYRTRVSLSGYSGTLRIRENYYDYIRGRKYSEFEPTYFLSSEETLIIPTTQNITSCQTLNVSDTIYQLTTDITDHSGNCFIVDANNITLNCYNNLVDGQDTGSAISLGSDHDNFKAINCNFKDWSITVSLSSNNDNATFVNNTFNSSSYGFYSSSDNNKNFNISYNSFFDLTNGGIYTASSTTNYWNITDNIFNNVGNSNYGAIRLYGQYSNVSNNVMDNCKYGVWRSANYYSNITNNTFKNGQWGLYLSRSSNNDIHNNRIINNSESGIEFYCTSSDCENNLIYNNFFNNTNNTKIDSDIQLNYWNTSYQVGERIYSDGTHIGGNYYTHSNSSGYSDLCIDLDHNGFCDDSLILETDNIDYFPLSDNYTVITTSTTTPTTTTTIPLTFGEIKGFFCSDDGTMLIENTTTWNGSNYTSVYNSTSCEYNCTETLWGTKCSSSTFFTNLILVIIFIGALILIYMLWWLIKKLM